MIRKYQGIESVMDHPNTQTLYRYWDELRAGRDADEVIHLTTSPSNTLWQKERMLNLAVARLPARCTKVAWIDADSFFTNERWVADTSALLDHQLVVVDLRRERVDAGIGRALGLPP